jgi:hypothetical protein
MARRGKHPTGAAAARMADSTGPNGHAATISEGATRRPFVCSADRCLWSANGERPRRRCSAVVSWVGVSLRGVSRPSSFGGEMNNERIRQRLERKIEQLNAKLESTRNPARRKKLRERKWALKAGLRGSS